MAADRVDMQEPVCLINNEEGGGLSVRHEALKILQQIQQPVVVVTIVGPYLSGKSYLMNRLAQKETGFALGNTVESKTKGIWMLCVPHPSIEGHTMVLLDTEGLGDVKGDSKHDVEIFALAILLSSTLVFNSRGTIDNKAIEELHYVAKLTNDIKVTLSHEGDNTQFVKFFPRFIWAVRDFSLELKIDSRIVTSDGYLEHALQLKPGHSKSVMAYNLPREWIRNHFLSRRCFTFPVPAELAENVADNFRLLVFVDSKENSLKDGTVLGHLAEKYVDITKLKREAEEEERRKLEVKMKEFDKVLESKMREQEEMLEKKVENLKQELEEHRRSHKEDQAVQARQHEVMMENLRSDRRDRDQRHEQTIIQSQQHHEQMMAEIRNARIQ